jgi:hypothetical protein
MLTGKYTIHRTYTISVSPTRFDSSISRSNSYRSKLIAHLGFAQSKVYYAAVNRVLPRMHRGSDTYKTT